MSVDFEEQQMQLDSALQQAKAGLSELDEESKTHNGTTRDFQKDGKLDEWPSISPLAYHGISGEFVRTIEPYTEADPVALLIQFHAAFGNIVGRNAHFAVESDRHSLNIFTNLVGNTSKGRKGTSWGHIRKVFQAIDPSWGNSRIVTGLSSGEGLIWEVRDRIYRREPIKDRGRVTDYQDVMTDSGIEDKRLLVLESEFASTLKVLRREGNTLSPLMRQSWDHGNLRAMTKNSLAHATEAHISIIGHISKEELLRLYDQTEASNGLFNRFLWVCVRRSKFLPEGGNISELDFTPFVQRLGEAVSFGSQVTQLKRDSQTRDIWHEVYPELSADRSGLTGAILNRAEAQVMRLACLYALEDLSTAIRPAHLQAALALWGYCEESVVHIFEEKSGNSLADKLIEALTKSPEGLTRTNIRDYFGRHKKADQINSALELLIEAGRVKTETRRTDGRSVEVVCLVDDQKTS